MSAIDPSGSNFDVSVNKVLNPGFLRSQTSKAAELVDSLPDFSSGKSQTLKNGVHPTKWAIQPPESMQ